MTVPTFVLNHSRLDSWLGAKNVDDVNPAPDREDLLARLPELLDSACEYGVVTAASGFGLSLMPTREADSRDGPGGHLVLVSLAGQSFALAGSWTTFNRPWCLAKAAWPVAIAAALIEVVDIANAMLAGFYKPPSSLEQLNEALKDLESLDSSIGACLAAVRTAAKHIHAGMADQAGGTRPDRKGK